MSYENLHELVDYARSIQIKDDNDLIVGVTGIRGSGKTTFSIQFSRRYCKKYLNEKWFNLKKYLAYTNRHIFDMMYNLPKYSPIVGDEAVRFIWGRDWNKADNKELIRLTTQIRPKKHILFLNIPKLAWIDKAYREGMIDMWVWIHSQIENGTKQGYALIFEPDQNQGESDSWHLNMLTKKKGKIEKIGRFTTIDKIYSIIKNHPCFMDIIKFPKLPNDIYDEYLKLRQKNVMEGEKEYINQKDMAKILCYNIKNNWKDLMEDIKEGRFDTPTYRMIANTLSLDPKSKRQTVNYTTVRNWVNEIAAKIPEQKTLIEDAYNQNRPKSENGT